ncbi:MAG: hypothetical protein K6G47_05405 [Clostridia bacterium]|nr:hypothetical protein [Clostridia bacterium]
MEEKTFILFKPDAMEDSTIQDVVCDRLEKLGLRIESEMLINVDEDCVCMLWDFTRRDEISRHAMMHFFNKKNLKLIQINGEDAIEKVNVLKKTIRKEYSRNFYCNCFHAPRNKKEYDHDIAYLLKKDKLRTPKNTLICDVKKFKKYSAFNKNEIKENAVELFERISNDGISRTIQSREKGKSDCNIYLINDDEHELVYAGVALYEFIPDIRISEAYMLAMGADLYGNVLVYSNKSKQSTQEIYNSLNGAGLKVRLEVNS